MNTKLIHKLLLSNAGFAAPILRVPLGIVLMAHGSQKLFGLFGGYGLQGTGQFMESVGFAPGYVMALLAGSGEFFGGLALILGLLTRPAAVVTAFTMIMAMTVHIGNGLFVTNNGYEYALILAVASLTLVVQGGGALSVDNKIAQRLKNHSDNNA
ncbi:MAG: DoxX family protein [Psychromonas sp.]